MGDLVRMGPPNLVGPKRGNGNRLAIEGHELDLVTFSLTVNQHDGADVPGRCAGDVWFVPHETVSCNADRGAHPATFPVALAERCLRLVGCSASSLVLDPFCGVNGITAAARIGARGIGIDIDPLSCHHAAAACGTVVEHHACNDATLDRDPEKPGKARRPRRRSRVPVG